MENPIQTVFLIHIIVTTLMTGIIWFIQLVHYPLLKFVGRSEAAQYEISHTRRITYSVIPLMIVESLTGFSLLWQRPPYVTLSEACAGGGLLAVIWLSTVFLQIPQHLILAKKFDSAAHQKLLSTNWVRTVAWTIRTLLVFRMLLK